jgi:tetratricopeptide (TPR) repeat protein
VRGIVFAALALGVPAAVFVVWPLVARRGSRAGLLGFPPDPREPWLEARGAALAALRELEFEHGAGHVSDADYAELRARYEADAAAAIAELDRLGDAPPPPRPSAAAPAPAAARGWRHPAALAASAVALVGFGVALGVGVVRYTEPDPMAGAPPAGSRPLATLEPGGPAAPPTAGAPRAVAPEVLQGMLGAARASLSEGRYGEAIAAYQAVLKREPRNVDALTHLGLIVAIGGHADSALETFAKALEIDPNYPPALLYQGEVLLEARGDAPGAIKSWEKFVAVTPAGPDRERVTKMIADARARRAAPGRR